MYAPCLHLHCVRVIISSQARDQRSPRGRDRNICLNKSRQTTHPYPVMLQRIFENQQTPKQSLLIRVRDHQQSWQIRHIKRSTRRSLQSKHKTRKTLFGAIYNPLLKIFILYNNVCDIILRCVGWRVSTSWESWSNWIRSHIDWRMFNWKHTFQCGWKW